MRELNWIYEARRLLRDAYNILDVAAAKLRNEPYAYEHNDASPFDNLAQAIEKVRTALFTLVHHTDQLLGEAKDG